MKSRDPDCKIPVSKEEFRCFKCDYPSPKEEGGWNEIEPGLDAKVCKDCYKPKKDNTRGQEKEEVKDILLGQPEVEGSGQVAVQPSASDV